MWRLTIYQKFTNVYESDGKEVRLDGEHPVSYESENISSLFNIIDMMASAYAIEETRYEIRKVVD